MATIVYALNPATGKVAKTVGPVKSKGTVKYEHDSATGKVKETKE